MKARRKEPLERPRCRWVNDIKMIKTDLNGVLWTGFNWLRIERSEGLL
jgi:hypothetical protein